MTPKPKPKPLQPETVSPCNPESLILRFMGRGVCVHVCGRGGGASICVPFPFYDDYGVRREPRLDGTAKLGLGDLGV